MLYIHDFNLEMEFASFLIILYCTIQILEESHPFKQMIRYSQRYPQDKRENAD